jgi:hypothetical protein
LLFSHAAQRILSAASTRVNLPPPSEDFKNMRNELKRLCLLRRSQVPGIVLLFSAEALPFFQQVVGLNSVGELSISPYWGIDRNQVVGDAENNYFIMPLGRERDRARPSVVAVLQAGMEATDDQKGKRWQHREP